MQQQNSFLGLTPEVTGGLTIFFAAFAALAFVNLGGGTLYNTLLEAPLSLGIAQMSLEKTVHHWINDGFMVLFFVLVGIEIHREFRIGSLHQPRQAAVPVLAALGGFVGPALVYLLITRNNPGLYAGWSIPAATDIAFAIALVIALKNHIPASLRAFILALAVTDDLLAILVIAIFYTQKIIWLNLFLAGATIVLLVIKNTFGFRDLWLYLLAGIFMWLCVLQSGVHATVAGVIFGALLPLKGGNSKPAPAEVVEHYLQPWVRWLILPLFAFANVGINLQNISAASILTPLTLAITCGLFLGKQLGVFSTVWILENLFKLPRPSGASWSQIYGVACLCGIGFTMSLFVGTLALAPSHQPEIRIGVLIGSLISALLAIFILKRS